VEAALPAADLRGALVPAKCLSKLSCSAEVSAAPKLILRVITAFHTDNLLTRPPHMQAHDGPAEAG